MTGPMKKLSHFIILSFLFLGYLHVASGQLADGGHGSPDISTDNITFGDPIETSIGGIRGDHMSLWSEPTCTPTGELIFISDIDVSPTVVGISEGTSAPEVHTYPTPEPQGYTNITSPLKLFVRDDSIALWVTGRPREFLGTETNGNQWVPLIEVFDRKGSPMQVVPLPKQAEVKAFGMYGSGNLLLVASDKSTHSAHLYVVSKSSDVLRELRLFDQDFNTAPDHQKHQPAASFVDDGALTTMQIWPSGDNLLLIPTMTSQPILEVNEFGIVRTVPLGLPKDTFIVSVLSVGPRSIVVKTSGSPNTIKTRDGEVVGMQFVTNAMYMFDRFDGSILRKIILPKDINPDRVTCFENGVYSAIQRNRENGHIVMRYSVPSK